MKTGKIIADAKARCGKWKPSCWSGDTCSFMTVSEREWLKIQHQKLEAEAKNYSNTSAYEAGEVITELTFCSTNLPCGWIEHQRQKNTLVCWRTARWPRYSWKCSWNGLATELLFWLIVMVIDENSCMVLPVLLMPLLNGISGGC